MSQRNSARHKALAILTSLAAAAILVSAVQAVAQDPKPLSDTASVTSGDIEAVEYDRLSALGRERQLRDRPRGREHQALRPVEGRRRDQAPTPYP